MSGHHPWSELTKDFTPERWKRIKARRPWEETHFPQFAVRESREDTRWDVAEDLSLTARGVAKLERQADAYLEHLRARIEAAGGQLTLVASFPQGEVVIRRLARRPKAPARRTPDAVSAG